MRKAVIDLGTNTFNLLIADVEAHGFEIILSEKIGVALGMGGINHQRITEDAVRRGMEAIGSFKRLCDLHHVEEICAFGTSALRDAKNTQFFVKEVSRMTGIAVEVISGKREAELIYQGVKWSFPFDDQAIIMDIGGGSTEFIIANKQGISDMVSLNIGVSRIYQHFKLSDPLTKTEISQIIEWLEMHSQGFFENKKEKILIGASGSFETFYELIYNEHFPSKVQSMELSLPHLIDNLNHIMASTQAERDRNEWIVPIRKKMAPIAAVKTKWVIDKLGIERTLVSPCALKEGALIL